MKVKVNIPYELTLPNNERTMETPADYLFSDAQSIIVIVPCLFQAFLLVKSLKPSTRVLSNRFHSAFKPFAILNTACVLGMLCGAGLAWWFSSMRNTVV